MKARRRAVGGWIRRRVVAALGEHRCLPIMKDDVIAYLIVADWKPVEREELYRSWCEVVGVDVLRSDLRRVRAARAKETIRSLDFGAPDGN